MPRPIVFLSLLILLPILVGATTLHVPADHTSIQLAYFVANQGDTILVADGIYSGILDRNIEFLAKAVCLISENGSAKTILDFHSSETDPHRGLWVSDTHGQKVRIEGFTFRGAHTIYRYNKGGALYFEGDSLEVVDCVFEGNYAPAGCAAWVSADWVKLANCRFTANAYGEWNWYDEEIVFITANSVSLIGCTFDSNLEKSLVIEAIELTASRCEFNGNLKRAALIRAGSITLDSCLFANNAADSSAILNIDADSLSVAHCDFVGNNSAIEAVLDIGGASSVFENCNFSDNSGYRTGGVAAFRSADLLFTDCAFIDNEGDSTAAILLHESSAGFVNCSFTGNVGQRGGAVWINNSWGVSFSNCTFDQNSGEEGGAVGSYNRSAVLMDGCSFTGNQATRGGALAAGDFAEPAAVGCEFTGNQATYGGVLYATSGSAPIIYPSPIFDNIAERGGVLYNTDGARARIIGCNIMRNAADSGSAFFGGIDGSGAELSRCIMAFSTLGSAISGEAPTLTCCVIYGNWSGDWTENIIDQLEVDGNSGENPLFCNPHDRDYTLREASPCLPENNSCGQQIGFFGMGCSEGETRVWHVDAGGTGDAPTIQAAVDLAGYQDTILLAPGVYRGDGNRDVCFKGKNLVIMAPTGPEFTTIDCEASETDRHRAFSIHSGESGNTGIIGITIKNGYAPLPVCPFSNDISATQVLVGGSVDPDTCRSTLPDYSINSDDADGHPIAITLPAGGDSLTRSGLTLRSQHTAPRYEQWTAVGLTDRDQEDQQHIFGETPGVQDQMFDVGDGGAVSVQGSSTTLLNCAILDNVAPRYGGGINVQANSSIIVENCTFARCGAPRGGGLAAGSYSVADVTASMFEGNYGSGVGAGMYFADGCRTTIDNCTIRYNHSGISIRQVCEVEIVNCDITDNGSVSWKNDASGIDCHTSRVSVRHTQIRRNLSYEGNGAGVDVVYGSIELDHCVITQNFNRYGAINWSDGGGLRFNRCAAVISNCTISDNHAYRGGNIHISRSPWLGEQIVITNSIISFSDGGLGIHGDAQWGDWLLIENSNIYGNLPYDLNPYLSELLQINNNFSEHPLFCDRNGGDYQLAAESPCLPENNSSGQLIGAFGVGCDMDPEVRWVKADGSGDAPTIQAAIDMSTHGDTIILADGTYVGDGNYDIDYRGKLIVVTSENGPEKTIIDCQATPLLPRRGFWFHKIEDHRSVLRGVTVRGGYTENGGGIFCDFISSPLIENCIITGSSVSGYAGGIIVQGSASIFRNCIISHNEGEIGGGIAINRTDSARFVNCTIVSNTASQRNNREADAMWFYNSSPLIENCIIAFGSPNNEAVYCEFRSAPRLVNSNIYGFGEGDWVGCIDSLYGVNGNISVDPLFCDMSRGNYRLLAESPCAPDNNPWGVLMGAGSVGCTPTDVDEPDLEDDLPTEFALSQNYPNPFNPATTIDFALPQRTQVELRIYNILGQQVVTLVEEDRPPGEYTVAWHGEDSHGRLVSTGVYFYRIKAGEFVETKKMLLLK